MKVKQYQINKAYPVLLNLSYMKLPFQDAYNVYFLLKKLENSYNFEISQEKSLILRHNGALNEDGKLNFPDHDSYAEFEKEMNELCMIDVDVDFEKVRIPMNSMEDISISPMDIMSISDFVDFY